ncbi:hypothetical protein BKA08_003709 [Nocardioides marinisabuli]|uniref:Septum formation-related domain-containing protein n=1 Tax=Nocardioides marinisabuli TaxID=419476 RepID=A0A7Y9F541_9ACTN|nr:hypothetical protein [Nocardioides marinisabuli]
MGGRQPPLGVLGAHLVVTRPPRTRRATLVVALAAAAALGACSDDGSAPAEPAASSSAPAPEPSEPPGSSGTAASAEPVEPPPTATCYRLSYDDAVAPTTSAEPVRCGAAHTAVTFESGPLDTVVDGHLLAVDSQQVADDVAERCPAALGDFVGGGADALRLSLLRSVWFTPSLEEADAGASWYRCDVVALAGAERLAELVPPMKGVLGTEAGRDRYGLCSTAEPGTPDFTRVLCSAEHTWRAVRVVELGGQGSGQEQGQQEYPGEDAARSAGQEPCAAAGREAADDPLDFSWGYEWPDAQQWEAGQRHGLCWVPD